MPLLYSLFARIRHVHVEPRLHASFVLCLCICLNESVISATMEGYDLIRGTGVDYMHGVLLGVVRQLLKLWFTPKYSSLPFSCCKQVDEVDERLLSIRPPSYITRLPRSIKQHVAYWKANECRAWLIFYSVPALCGVLSNDYYQHHLLIVEAIHILCKVEISQADLVHCRRVLIHYVATFWGSLLRQTHDNQCAPTLALG